MANRLDGLKAIVIDDSQTVRHSVEALLKSEGAQVVLAVDGFDALAKIVESGPDIIFVDIMMPKLDGYQTCALIKHNRAYKNIPIILLSSSDGLFDKAKGKIVGADEYLTKPISKEDLMAVTEKQLLLTKERIEMLQLG